MPQPKILLLDIETSPLISYTWGLFDQNIGLNQIHTDWNILSFSAKWLGSPTIMYKDLRNQRDITNDRVLLKPLWKLLDEADIVLTQNGKKFDIRKVNARFIMNQMPPPSPFRQIDTLTLARKHFGFTSNKLEYMTSKLCTKYKKLTHKKFPGFELWKECLAGNQEAWKEMEKYNKHDVLSLEELYTKMASWGTGINFEVYSDSTLPTCNCGSEEFVKNGYQFSPNGKYQRFRCKKCASYSISKENLLTKEKRKSIRKKL
jgi:DNA polymerase III epsilon subunit-like protein